ncbi:MAG: hypothetical protein WC835_01020 [Candidatus Paceibacterota bacterium]|jgi:hypothetical protein
MSEAEKKEIAQRLTTRVSTGVLFVELNYLDRHSTPDAAWIRNIYILLSFYTELLLKAIFTIKGNFVDVANLDERLRKMGHNLETIGKEIGSLELLSFGIKNIKYLNPKDGYIVETETGCFYVQDFNEIRYDFMDSRVRTLDGSEHDMFRKQIGIMIAINRKLKPLVW